MLELVTTYELVNKLKINRHKIYDLIKLGKFPKPLNIGCNKHRWDIKDIETWIQERKQ